MIGTDPVCDGDPGSTASSLIAGVKNLDPDAWRNLASLYGPLIYSWARRAGLRGEDAADVTQEVFRAVATSAARLHHGQPGNTFRGWLWTVTRNKIRDFWRSQANRPHATGGTDGQDLLMFIAQHDFDSQSGASTAVCGVIHRAIQLVRGEFEGRTWDAFWRMTIEERSAQEVAQELGMTANAVYVARSRILRRLRDLLSGSEFTPES